MNEEIQRIADDAIAVLEGANDRQVLTTADFVEAGEELQEVKAVRIRIENERCKITKPMNDSLRATNAFFAKADEPYERAEDVLRRKISGYLDASKAAEREAMAASTNAVDLVLATEAAPTLKGLGARAVYEATVTDPVLVPDEYWVIDEKRIKAVVKAAKGRIEIPGVMITSKTGLTVTAAK